MRTCPKFMPFAGIVVVGLLVASCGDDDSAAPTTTAAVPTTAVSTTTTEPPPTTAAPTTAAPTTAAPTTTEVDPIVQTRRAIRRAVVKSRRDYVYAIDNYDAPDALERLRESTVEGGPSWNLTIDNMETMRANGWKSRDHPDVEDRSIVESIVLPDGPASQSAKVIVCTVDAGVVFEPSATPDGGETIVNDQVTAYRDRIRVVSEDGAWKLHSGDGIGQWEGASECPFD